MAIAVPHKSAMMLKGDEAFPEAMKGPHTSVRSLGDAAEESEIESTDCRSSHTTPEGPKVRFRGMVLALAIAGYWLFAYDNSMLANLRPRIIKSLGEVDKLPMLSTAYALANVVMVLLYGQLYRTFNMKWVFCASSAVFTVGSAVCGAAPTMDALIAGRVLCGIGGSGLYTGTLNYIAALTTLQERPKFMGMVGVCYALGLTLGPIVGGAFADNESASWRWAFYFSLIVSGVVTPLYAFLLPPVDAGRGRGLADRLSQLDLAGWLLFAGAVTSFVVFGSMGGSVWSWSSGRTIALIVFSAVCMIAFLLQQWLGVLVQRQHRLLPIHLLRNPELAVLFVHSIGCVSSGMVVVYFLPVFFGFAHGDSALAAGVKLLPAVGTLAFGTLLSGAVMGKAPIYMPWYLLGSTMVLAGGILLHFMSIDSSASYIMGVSVVAALGAGLYAQLAFTVSSAKVFRSDSASATALMAIAQLGGVCIFLVVSNCVFLNQATAKIAAVLPTASRTDIVNAVSGADSRFLASLPTSVQHTVLIEIIAAIRQVMFLVIVAGGLSTLLSFFMKREKLGPREEVTPHDTARMQMEKV